MPEVRAEPFPHPRQRVRPRVGRSPPAALAGFKVRAHYRTKGRSEGAVNWLYDDRRAADPLAARQLRASRAAIWTNPAPFARRSQRHALAGRSASKNPGRLIGHN